ncbi:MAG: DUF4173 domain-containing protein, partial [Propionibacteriaceae bacterium]|nr:DUF4173 domain-containing protein [Propionibacteriaceae bacterium]
PFALFPATPASGLLALVEAVGLVTWTVFWAGDPIARRADADLAADLANQAVAVPLGNVGAWPAALAWATRRRRHARRALLAVAGIALGLPLLIVVTVLLDEADATFAGWLDRLGELTQDIVLEPSIVWPTLLMVPLGAFGFTLLHATARGSRRGRVTRASLDAAQGWLRRFPTAFLAAPVGLLCALYVAFCAALGSYLFSGLAGHLPEGWTYAEYARRGFFELAAVAAINLAVVAALRLLARRDGGRYPATLRALGLVLSLETLLLIVTALSKTLLYTDAYGLTRLRVYVLAFTVTLFAACALLAVWHVRPFALSRALVPLGLAAVLALGWANVDGLVARWNVGHYLSGDLKEVDIDYLAKDLSYAAAPALRDLAQQAPDAVTRSAAAAVLTEVGEGWTDDVPWTAWTWAQTRLG